MQDRSRFAVYAAMGVSVLFWLAQPVSACELCCALCGHEEATTKVCRLVCTEKKISVTCWSCEADDICLPAPSHKTCQHWDVACEDPSCPDSHHHGLFQKYFVWSDWTPSKWGCCQIRTKKRLMKKTVTKTIPSYKWVVEELCPQCEEQQQTVFVPSETEIPPAPAVEGAKVLAVETVPAQK